jgi:hypothetical protein
MAVLGGALLALQGEGLLVGQALGAVQALLVAVGALALQLDQLLLALARQTPLVGLRAAVGLMLLRARRVLPLLLGTQLGLLGTQLCLTAAVRLRGLSLGDRPLVVELLLPLLVGTRVGTRLSRTLRVGVHPRGPRLLGLRAPLALPLSDRLVVSDALLPRGVLLLADRGAMLRLGSATLLVGGDALPARLVGLRALGLRAALAATLGALLVGLLLLARVRVARLGGRDAARDADAQREGEDDAA